MDSQRYEIRVEGHLESDWSDWFDGLAISLEPKCETGPACTVLSGPMDQSALRGVLDKVFNLALPLISVCRVGEVGFADEEPARA